MLAAGDGGEALTRLGERSDMQLVLTDIVMPRMNGRDLMTRVRATPAVPVLFMSGYAYDESMREDVALAEVPVLSKPFRARSWPNSCGERSTKSSTRPAEGCRQGPFR